MGNIVNDIVDNIEIKPNKTKLYLKWGASIAGTLIVVAFTFGQFKSSFFNRMDKFEETMNKNTASIEVLKTDINEGFEDVNARIDKGYSDGLEALQDYQEFNKKQLILVLDYGQTNKELLKEMLEMNMQEKAKSVENQMNKAKNGPINMVEKPEFSIGVQRIEPEKKSEDYLNMIHFIEVETNDTIFNLTGATMEYINKIDTNKYKLGAIIENPNHPRLYDVSYRKK